MSFSITNDTVTLANRSSTLALKTTTATVSDKISTKKIVMDNTGKIAVGRNVNTSGNSISIGFNTGNGTNSINIGRGSNSSNANNSICISFAAGQNTNQGNNVCIGYQTGNFNAGQETVLFSAGYLASGTGCTSIGPSSSYNPTVSAPTYNRYSTNIGYATGYSGQGINCVAIGNGAGFTNQGNNAIAIGFQAGFNLQPANSIVLNASNTSLSPSIGNAFYINPVRSVAGPVANLLSWDSGTSEIYLNTSKTFVIDHPVENDKYLVHACLEGPEAGVYYRGQSEIVNGESVEVTLPEYVKSFSDFTVQITGIYNGIEIINYNAGEVIDGKFTVYGKNGSFYWLVQAMRLPIETEPLKSETEVRGDGPYRYIV